MIGLHNLHYLNQRKRKNETRTVHISYILYHIERTHGRITTTWIKEGKGNDKGSVNKLHNKISKSTRPTDPLYV